MKLFDKYEDNINYLSKKIGVESSFDTVRRDIVIGGKKAAVFFIDGFAKDDIMLYLLAILQNTKHEEIVPNTLEKLITKKIPYIECSESDSYDEIEYMILSGASVLVIDGINKAIILDTRTYPARGPQEPDLEKVTRGSRDGFVETVIFNTALIRRRVRDPNLRFHITNVGRRSKTDVVIGYIEDITNEDLVKDIKEKLEQIDIDSLVMAEKSLEEYILGKTWNPFPQARFTERPDVTAAHLLEGHIVIIVDTTPSVMILPVTMFHFTQHAEDYYQNPTIGTYMRWVRFLAIFFSLVASPLWLVLANNPELLPEALSFIGPKEIGEIPLLLQFLVLEIGLDMLRIASIHTPNALTTSLGIIGALLLSDFAVKVGWIIPETVLYTAISGIGMFATPSVEFSLAMRLFRLVMLVAGGLFGPYGLLVGFILFIIVLFNTKSFGGINYMWPLVPFNRRALSTIVTRKPIPEVKRRPEILRPIDKTSKK
ncbi:spore germination protein [Clostridium sp. D2Q-11]|uniref:Spore germination protein n=1 Tax=Anaeromonas frigoriresistens TaxID=2683708 RepID=A0A942V0G3_9FIRM|nr:spore germination protein [Anaeromonas frigoriresistens]MBS4539626.1 spore germination protein [Anaeromonas frigoriresistens]